MATDWREAVDLGDREPGRAPEPEGADERSGGGLRGRLRRVRESLAASRRALATEIAASVSDRLGDTDWERLEEALILADCGASTTARIVGRLEEDVESGSASSAEQVRERLVELLAEEARVGAPRLDLSGRPSVVMVVGVNGTGKTTTIGKLAAALRRELGLSVLVAAADTYRAAAIEQLEAWAERAGAELVRGTPGGDPGAVVYDAIEAASARGIDVVVVDTAGRLHTHSNLMDELAKVRRVAEGRLPDAPHETLLVIDATTGQNGLRQAKVFADAVEVDGVAVTKLDGTAKGGIALAIASELSIPVKLVGTGEALEDIRPFDALEFASGLVGD